MESYGGKNTDCDLFIWENMGLKTPQGHRGDTTAASYISVAFIRSLNLLNEMKMACPDTNN